MNATIDIEPSGLAKYSLKKTNLGNDYIHQEYASWNDFVRDIFYEDHPDSFGSYKTQTYTLAFNGIVGNIHHLREAVEIDWPQATMLMEQARKLLPLDMFEKLMPSEQYAEEIVEAEAGSMINVPDFLAGSPTPFREFVPSELIKAGNKLIRLHYNISQSCTIPSATLAALGVMLYGLVEHLEKIGYSVEVTIHDCNASTSTRTDVHTLTSVRLKEFGHYFDKHKMEVALIAPFCLRGLFFIAEEKIPSEFTRNNMYCSNKGYGFPITLNRVAYLNNEIKIEAINPQAIQQVVPMVVDKINEAIKRKETEGE